MSVAESHKMSANLKAVETQQPPTIADVDPTKQYIAGGYLFGYGGALPPLAPDDWGLCVGLETYQRMARDPDIWAALLLLKILVLADGVELQPAVAKPEAAKFKGEFAAAQKSYERAKEISDFCARSIECMRPGVTTLFEEMLDALIFGNKIAEVTLKDGIGVDRGKLVFDSIKPKPYTAVQFVIDKFWNLRGFLPTWQIDQGARKVLPREKFFYLSLHQTNNDPRGNSSLRPCVDAYNFKQELWPTYTKWLKLCAIHKLIARIKNGGTPEKVTDENGEVVMVGNKPKTVTRARAVLTALEQMVNATVAVVDIDDEVDAHETTGTGEQFDRGFTIADKQLTKALLLQELATRDSTHQTKGSTASQSQYIDLMVWYLKNRLIDEFRSQPLTLLVQANYGEDDAREYLPGVGMGDSERKDWAEDSDALTGIGPMLTDSQWLQGTDQLGFKRPDDGEMLPVRVKAKAAEPADEDEQ